MSLDQQQAFDFLDKIYSSDLTLEYRLTAEAKDLAAQWAIV